MMERQNETLEQSIEQLADDFATGISDLATGGYLREGVMKQGVTAVIWAVYHAFPDQRFELAEFLEDWPNVINNAIRDDKSEERA
ncbi:hypothetical protein [Sphingobium sp. HDIP04]|uniref:hypothetical protein n=1 Tax=Sphingobium sp. HDIP04 TaxID=428994 RepID=UPI0003876E83|nr:hypothetical protein [Sphingobium sp. HDIP04]EQB03707.1 hypothetical protein L286_11850 [Sphingobium sp. HDIP04]